MIILTPLLYRLKILKLFDLLEQKAAVFMYQAYHNKLSHRVQVLYQRNISNYSLRNPYHFKKKNVNSNVMKMCMSVYGIDLLQNILHLVQNCNTLFHFKKTFKENILSSFLCKV